MARILSIIGFLVLGILSITMSPAQEDEKSALIRFVEEQISAPNRQISLNGLEGALSSDVQLESITIADDDGIWLRITSPELTWSRTALLTGTLSIEELTAERIDFLRTPNPDESLPSPEARRFQIPELPIAINLGRLAVPVIAFGEDVFGLQSQASVEGRFILSGGSLDLALDVNRLGDTGGSLAALIAYDGDAETLNMSIDLNEPENGIVANAVGLKDKPPVELSITGNAPIADLAVTLDFDVARRDILDGVLTFQEVEGDLTATLRANGPLSTLFDEDVAAFLGSETVVSSDMRFNADGTTDLSTLRISSGVVDANAAASLLSDGFLKALNAEISLSEPGGTRVLLPTGTQETSFETAKLDIAYDLDLSENWSAQIAINGLEADKLAVERTILAARGAVRNVTNRDDRSVDFQLRGDATTITSEDDALQRALGETISLTGRGRWQAGEPLRLEQLNVAGNTFRADLVGLLRGTLFEGRVNADIAELNAFAPLAGRDLKGSTTLSLDGNVDPLSGGFDVMVDGTGSNIALGSDRVDALLQGDTTLQGRAARTEDGLLFDTFALINEQMRLGIAGQLASETADLELLGRIQDIAVLEERSSGELRVQASIRGAERPFDVNATLSIPEGRLMSRPVERLSFSFDGTKDGRDFAGNLTSAGTIQSVPVDLTGNLSSRDAVLTVSDLNARIVETHLTGDVERDGSTLFAGTLALQSEDIGPFASLALVDVGGALDATLILEPRETEQRVEFSANANGLRSGPYRIGEASITSVIDDAFGQPKINAEINGRGAQLAGTRIDRFSADVDTQGSTTEFDVAADVAALRTAQVRTRGTLVQDGNAIDVEVAQLSIDSAGVNATLKEPARLSLQEDVTTLEPSALVVGSGEVRLGGRFGETLDATVVIDRLPLEIANAFVSNLGVAGIVNGNARFGGSAQNLAGTFDINGSDLSVATIRQAGLSPLSFNAAGNLAQQRVTLSRAEINSADGVHVTLAGTIPIDDGSLDIVAKGAVPLTVAQPLLRDRSTRLNGTARFDINATGPIAAPRLTGLASIENGSLSDPLSNVALENINVLAGLRDQTLTITRANARFARGGNLNASGTVVLRDDLPIDISFALENAVYNDGQMIAATVNGDLTANGSLLRNPTLQGRLDFDELTITVPDSFASGPDLLSVAHINPSLETRETLARIERADPREASREPSILQLDLTISAPRRIFVRGRGLDAELGGTLRLTGSATNVSPVGSFNLIRGRLVILNKRFDLDSGSVAFSGDLNPQLNFVASTRASDVDAFITLSGTPANLSVMFTSNPELPEDEVLARIIFDRGITDLSPVQIARLASAVGELTGGPSLDVLGNLRSSTGLDDLDIVNEDDGSAAVQAGRYISNNVYVGVKTGAETEATINLDVSRSLTARGAVDTEGNTSLGIFFERDY